jgi:hypothetical protein
LYGNQHVSLKFSINFTERFALRDLKLSQHLSSEYENVRLVWPLHKLLLGGKRKRLNHQESLGSGFRCPEYELQVFTAVERPIPSYTNWFVTEFPSGVQATISVMALVQW